MSLPLNDAILTSSGTANSGAAKVCEDEILSDPERQFARNFNRRSFMFPHGLKDHPLFELSNLVALAKRPFHRDPYWSNGNVYVTDPWGTSRDHRLTLVDTIANIGNNNSMVILKHVEEDPEYAPVFRDFLARVVEFTGEEMRQEAVVGEVLVLLTSPNRVTSYHMDAESNFLVQAVGDKTVWVYSHTDRTLVSHAAREGYYLGNYNSLVYEEKRLRDANVYELKAGFGVHIPSFAPHWVRNHDNISVALSVNYETRSMLAERRIYRVNGMLRKLGPTPTPPGVSPLRDRLKSAVSDGLYAAYSLIRSARRHPVSKPS